jgi:hypothetical protein
VEPRAYQLDAQAWKTLTVAILVFGLGTLFLALRALLRWNVSPVRYRLREDAPVAVAVHEMAKVLVALAEAEADWSDVGRKREIVHGLNTVARTFDPHMGMFFRCGHNDMDSWIARRCAQISSAFQELARQAFAPSRESYEEVKQRAGEMFANLVEGTWDALPAPSGEEVKPFKTLGARLLPVMRRLAIVSIPVLLLACYNLLPESSGRQKLTAEGMFPFVLLTLSGLLSVLNPQLQADVGIAKSLGEFLKPRPGK